MSNITDMPPRRLAAVRVAGLIIPLLVLMFLGGPILLPGRAIGGQDSPEAAQLKQDAQKAFLARDYAKASALDQEIARKYPDSVARRYAVQMLGTIYEDYIVDVKKAVESGPGVTWRNTQTRGRSPSIRIR